MKRTKSLILFCLMLLSTATFSQNWWKSAIRGEGAVVSQDLDLDVFEGFTLAFSGDVILSQGPEQAVRVEAQQNIIDNIVTEVNGRHWKIKFDRPVRSTKGVTVYITLPRLEEVYVSGSGDIESRNSFTNVGDLAVGVSGSGSIDLDLEAKGRIQSRISGSGAIRLAGGADALDVTISGSGDVEAYDLEAAQGQVQISGSGDAEVHVTGELEVRISGSGDVTYKGTPRMRSKVSGSGDVNSY